jgi:hypothetical protein
MLSARDESNSPSVHRFNPNWLGSGFFVVDGLASSCKIPPPLHTCSRSRGLALQAVDLVFPDITSVLESELGSEQDVRRREAKISLD